MILGDPTTTALQSIKTTVVIFAPLAALLVQATPSGWQPMPSAYLMKASQALSHSNFSDPAKLHGTDITGLAELTANADKFTASYFEEANGAGIRFETEDLTTLTAIHRWFGAQLSEHGADARAE